MLVIVVRTEMAVQHSRGEHLERQIAAQPIVVCAVNHAHAASSDLLDNPVTAKDFTDHA
jgi:hypothetical protein